MPFDEEGEYTVYHSFKDGFVKHRNCVSFANYNMNATMPHVHYSNSYWNEARTVWGAEEKGLHYVYSDRLYQWDYEKADKCWKEAAEKFPGQTTPARLQLYLSLYEGKEVELRHIMAGVNVSNGYDYWVYGYKVKA